MMSPMVCFAGIALLLSGVGVYVVE